MTTRASARLQKKSEDQLDVGELDISPTDFPKPISRIDEEVDNTGQEVDSEHDESEQEEQRALKKRRQTTTKKTKGASGKRVRGQQGRLSGLVKMPVDIFTEIASHLLPIDIISLSRSNKSFRNLLMNRSSAHIWHAAMKNIPDLPPCPPELSEPSYLSLLFSKTCSMCGKTARAGLDEVLLVRLCVPCRDVHLISLNSVPDELTSFVSVSQSIAPGNRAVGNGYALREGVTKLRAEYEEMLCSENKNAWETWARDRERYINQRKQEAQVLATAMSNIDLEQRKIRSGTTQARRSEIERRLGELGWTEKDMSFSWFSKNRGAYEALVNQPKPLTERIWANIEPKLIPLLQANRDQHLEQGRLERLQKRRDRLSEFLTEIKDQGSPVMKFQVRLSDPLPADADQITTVSFHPPFPSLSCMLPWPVLKDLHETERTIAELEAHFEEKREEVQSLITGWKNDNYTRFANLISPIATIPEGILQPTTIISDNVDFLSNIPDELKLLLRADTFFYEDSSSYTKRPEIYEGILRSKGLVGAEYSVSPAGELRPVPDLGKFRFYPEARAIAQVLLLSMGRPNATHIEMEAVRLKFRCGRCHEDGMSWGRIVDHYISEKKLYIKVQEVLSFLSRDIPYNDIHNPELHPDRPLVEYRLASEPTSTWWGQGSWRQVCQLCKKIPVIHNRMGFSTLEIMRHLLDVHGISEPKIDEHYVTQNNPIRNALLSNYLIG